MPTISALVAGRRWYDIVATGRYGGVDGMYGGHWKGPVFVVTHRPPDGPHHPAITFATTRLADALAKAKHAAAGKNVALFGADIPRQCVGAGLVDDISLHLAPVLLGGGVRLFDAPGTNPACLERVSVARAGQLGDEHRDLRRPALLGGIRVWGRGSLWDYNGEVVYQWGRFGSAPIRAWTVASDTGATLQHSSWRPRLGLKADVTSGDHDPSAPALQSFNPLFPRGSYFGETH